MNRVIKERGALPNRVIVFSRFPEPGLTKTRMIPALGAELAAQLQLALTKRTLRAVRDSCLESPSDMEVRFAGGSAENMAGVFGADHCYQPQEGSDLGERLIDAFAKAFSDGAERVVVIGSDCPGVDSSVLESALDALKTNDIALGPSLDGGYYLIGLKKNQTQLFRGIRWGSESVMRQTIDIAKQSRCSVHLLQPLSDVDYPEDLVACRCYPESFAGVLPQTRKGVLSIVIPTLNEEQRIEEALNCVVGLSNVEVIVADGGSDDATRAIAERMGARVVLSNVGRGRQMNAGAAMASGDVLLFLHADCRLPDDYHDLIRSTLSEKVIAGAFTLRIDGHRFGLRLIEQGVRFRSRFLRRPYGDQGIFLSSDWFFRLNGFPNWPILEDVEFCRRIRKYGKVSVISGEITTSARRWMKLGVWRTTILNQLCLIGFRIGVSPEKLNRWYRSRH